VRKTNNVRKEIVEEPIEIKCNTKDFAVMIQLFLILTKDLDFSRPFRVMVEYDPEQPRTKIKLFEPMDVLQQYIQKARGKEKD